VEGRLQIRDWTDRDGGKRRSAEVVVDNMYFGESRRRESSDTNGYDRAPAQNRSTSSYGGGYSAPSYGGGFSDLSDDDGELPF